MTEGGERKMFCLICYSIFCCLSSTTTLRREYKTYLLIIYLLVNEWFWREVWIWITRVKTIHLQAKKYFILLSKCLEKWKSILMSMKCTLWVKFIIFVFVFHLREYFILFYPKIFLFLVINVLPLHPLNK